MDVLLAIAWAFALAPGLDHPDYRQRERSSQALERLLEAYGPAGAVVLARVHPSAEVGQRAAQVWVRWEESHRVRLALRELDAEIAYALTAPVEKRPWRRLHSLARKFRDREYDGPHWRKEVYARLLEAQGQLERDYPDGWLGPLHKFYPMLDPRQTETFQVIEVMSSVIWTVRRYYPDRAKISTPDLNDW